MDFLVQNIMSKAEGGDPIAMYQIANYYDIGLLPDTSDGKYIYWFKRFWDTPEVKATVYNIESDEYNDETADPMLEMLLRSYIVEAGLALGLYYMNSTNIREATFALECFSSAWSASAFDYLTVEDMDGTTDIQQLIRKQQAWLKELEVSSNASSDE